MSSIKAKSPVSDARVRDEDVYSRLDSVLDDFRHVVAKLEKIVGALVPDPPAAAARRRPEHSGRLYDDGSLSAFVISLVATLNRDGRIRTAETYVSALNSFRSFLGSQGIAPADINMRDVTPDTMEHYQAWLRRRGLAPNTISFYARILRAIYNRAVERGLTVDRRPFRHVYTGVDKTVKRALPLAAISRIRSIDLSGCPSLDYARDMFMMSFYLRGMSLIDMAFLKKTDLRDGCVTYRRRKTGRRLDIRWTREMQHIIDKYPADTCDYLLPIIRRRGLDELRAYRNAGYNINRGLKKIADMAGIGVSLTLYVARHSWASCARDSGIPLGVISEGMGHDSETTTRIYLSSLDTSVIDKANALILASL